MDIDSSEMKLTKSSRHSKITGDFGESLVLYWLSKYGFECAMVDHTGIDLIARNPNNEKVLGISVKSRSRTGDTKSSSLNIGNANFEKAAKACEAFGCIPYFAIVIDAGDKITVFVLSMEELERIAPQGKSVSSWKMSPKYLEQYKNNPNIMMIELSHNTPRWF